MREVVIVDAVRTPVGRRNGALSSMHSADLLAVPFKALFDRPKDWVDITTMIESNALDVEVAAQRLAGLLGDDARVGRLRGLAL